MDSKVLPAQITEQESIIVQPKAPWLQQNGKPVPDELLKTLAPSWSAEVWEKYLVWFENLNGSRGESLVIPKRYDRICESEEESIFSAFAQTDADDELKSIVSRFLLRLTPQQRRVVEMIFWEGRSERYVAQSLGINQQPVNRLKKRALSKIKHLISEGVSSRIMRGEQSSLINKGDADAEILLLAESHLAEAG
jgi:RNA polymerase sigma factor (sigma-70 family)